MAAILSIQYLKTMEEAQYMVTSKSNEMKTKKIIAIVVIIILIAIIGFYLIDKYVGNVFDLHQ
jgi:hypothetical protein